MKNCNKVPIALAAGSTIAVLYALSNKEKKKKREENNISVSGLRIINLACDCLGILGQAEEKNLPIDSARVKRIRKSTKARKAERLLFITFVERTSQNEGESCSLKGLCELVCGPYTINRETLYNLQIMNAGATVEAAMAYRHKDIPLQNFAKTDLIHGAVLLENDLTWTAKQRGIEH